MLLVQTLQNPRKHERDREEADVLEFFKRMRMASSGEAETKTFHVPGLASWEKDLFALPSPDRSALLPANAVLRTPPSQTDIAFSAPDASHVTPNSGGTKDLETLERLAGVGATRTNEDAPVQETKESGSMTTTRPDQQTEKRAHAQEPDASNDDQKHSEGQTQETDREKTTSAGKTQRAPSSTDKNWEQRYWQARDSFLALHQLFAEFHLRLCRVKQHFDVGDAPYIN